MQCEEFEDRINAVLDRRERPEWDSELRLHCETCPECRELAAAYGATLDGFYTLCASAVQTDRAVPADMADRVLANLALPVGTDQLGTEPIVEVRRRQSRTALRAALAVVSLSTAAGLLIAFLPGSQHPATELERKSSASPQVAAPMPEPSTVAAGEQAAVEESAASSAEPGLAKNGKRRTPTIRLLLPKWLTAKRKQPVDPYAAVFKDTGRGLATLLLQVPGFGGRRGIIDAKENADTEPAWAVQVSEGLGPVTDSVTETFNILLQTFAMTNLANRS